MGGLSNPKHKVEGEGGMSVGQKVTGSGTEPEELWGLWPLPHQCQ